MLSQDKINELQNCLHQLCAGLELTYGGSGPSFRESGEATQDSFLWMLAEKAQHCLKLVGG